MTASLQGRPSSEVFLSSVGTGLSVSLIYLGVAGALFSPEGAGLYAIACPIVFIAVISALYALLIAVSDRVSAMNLRTLMFAGAAISALAALGALALPQSALSLSASCLLSAAFAVGVVLMKCAGVRDYAYASADNSVLMTVVVMASLAASVFCASALGLHERRLLALGIVAVSVVFYCFSGESVKDVSGVDQATSKTNLKLDGAVAVSYGLTGVVIGYLVARGASAAGGPDLLLALLGAAIGLSALLAGAAALAGKQTLLMLSPLYRATFLPLVACVLVLPLVSGLAWWVVFFCALVVSFLRDFSRVLNRFVVVSETQYQPIHVYMWTSLPLIAGLGAGLVLFVPVGLDAMPPQAASVLLTLLLCAASVVAPYGMDPQSMPLREPQKPEEGSRPRSFWHEACQDIGSEASFTPREADVALYLSRGRTADVIAGSLGISVYTVKTHISNVYRKANVASQQEFVSLVEDRFRQLKSDDARPKERL